MDERWTAIYKRVSSHTQSTASQAADLERWVNVHIADDEQCYEYEDVCTGTTMSREGWDELVTDMQSGQVSTLVCWRLDRLGRSAAGLTALFEDLQRWKVNLISIKDALDLSTASGRLMANVLASVAMFETEVRSERQRAGIAAARERGVKWGGSEAGKRKVVTDEQFELLRQLRDRGSSKAEMARLSGLSRPTIYSVLAELQAAE